MNLWTLYRYQLVGHNAVKSPISVATGEFNVGNMVSPPDISGAGVSSGIAYQEYTRGNSVCYSYEGVVVMLYTCVGLSVASSVRMSWAVPDFFKRALKGGGGNRVEGKRSQCFVTLACRRLSERSTEWLSGLLRG